jgi:hypothetical protein
MTGLTVPEQWTHHEIDARFNYDALPGAQDGTLTDQQEHSLRAGYEKLNEVAHDELASRGENDADAQRAAIAAVPAGLAVIKGAISSFVGRKGSAAALPARAD